MRATVVSIERLRSKVPDLHVVTLDVSYSRARQAAGPSGRVRLVGVAGRAVQAGLAIRQPEEAAWLLISGPVVELLSTGSVWELVSSEIHKDRVQLPIGRIDLTS